MRIMTLPFDIHRFAIGGRFHPGLVIGEAAVAVLRPGKRRPRIVAAPFG